MSITNQNTILLISNNPIGKDTNNGLTIYNFLLNYSPDRIINLYIKNSVPSEKLAKSYYRITNNEILRFGFFRKIGTEVSPSQLDETSKKHNKSITKSPLKFLIRDWLWSISNWNNKSLNNWIKRNNPKLIVLQIGDFPYLIKITRTISKKYGIPVVIYNSENYFFKNHNYFDRTEYKVTFFYKLFLKKLRAQYEIIGSNTSWFHLNESILEKYKKIFPTSKHYLTPNGFIGQTTVYSPVDNRFNIYYFGNLEVGRSKLLKDFAELCLKTNKNINIYIYGSFNKIIVDELSNVQNIVFLGFKTMEKILDEAKSSCDLVIHIESFEEKDIIDNIDAFSTKIPTCLHLGVPFLVYAPLNYSFVKYLKDNDACFLATSRDDCVSLLQKMVKDTFFRYRFLKKGIALANNSFDPYIISKTIKDVLDSLIV